MVAHQFLSSRSPQSGAGKGQREDREAQSNGEGLKGLRGVIAAGNHETAAAGVEILRAGGNAADAAVAAAFVSFISEVGFVHLGGSGMAQAFDPDRGAIVYDFFSNHPGLGRKGRPKSLDFHPVWVDYGNARQSFHLGRASVAVPGNLFGLFEIARDLGRLPFAVLLQPAIRRAEEGVVLDQFQSDTCKLLEPLYTHTEGMREIFAPQGRLLRTGERLRIPGLASTLKGLADQGVTYLREGSLGRALIEDQERHGGLLTGRDLKAFQVSKRSPIGVPYRNSSVLLPPLSSLGGVLTAFATKLLSRFEPSRHTHGSAEHLRLIAEVMLSATEARRWLDESEPATKEDRATRLLEDSYVEGFAAKVRRRLHRREAGTGWVEPRGPSSTSHLSVLDEEGRAVSLTTTAGESAGYVVPGTGFIPNNMLGEDDLHPEGFHTGTPGSRIHTMITPSLVVEGDRVTGVLGTGGSTRIRSATLQVLSNLLDFGFPLPQAVDAPRIHYEGILQCEGGLDPAAIDQLEATGYPVNRWNTRSIYFGGAHCVGRQNHTLVGAGDPRRGGAIMLNTSQD